MQVKYKIACVIVTYNRKNLLKRCLDAVASQSFKPTVVYITDNASTDGTLESVKEWGYYECEKNGTTFKYLLNSKNEGGAGGFYLGMMTAFKENVYDGIWVMDDDGEPEKECLKELSAYLGKYDYIAPIVLSDEDHRSCSFALNYEDIDVFKNKMGTHDGVIDNWASPFNGILYSNWLISKVGFPKKEMFIWGDEANYHARAIKAGFCPLTVLRAVHYHPLNRQEYINFWGREIVSNISSDWKLYCYLRNVIYNTVYFGVWFPKNIYRSIRIVFSNVVFYVRQGKPLSLLLSAVIAGYFGYWGGNKKLMN